MTSPGPPRVAGIYIVADIRRQASTDEKRLARAAIRLAHYKARQHARKDGYEQIPGSKADVVAVRGNYTPETAFHVTIPVWQVRR